MPCLISEAMITLELDYNTHRRQRRSWSEKAGARCRCFLREVALLPKAALGAFLPRERASRITGRASAGLR